MTPINNLVSAEILSRKISDLTVRDSVILEVSSYTNDEISQMPGDTIKKIRFKPNKSKAQRLAKGDSIESVALESVPVSVTVEHLATAMDIYDIELMSNPDRLVERASTQMSGIIKEELDLIGFNALNTTSFSLDLSEETHLDSTAIFKAKAKLPKVVRNSKTEDLILFVTAEQEALLYADEYKRLLPIDPSKNLPYPRIANNVYVVVSDHIKAADGKVTNILTTSKALEVGFKRQLNLEPQRIADKRMTKYSVDTVGYVHLENEHKALKLIVSENPVAKTSVTETPVV